MDGSRGEGYAQSADAEVGQKCRQHNVFRPKEHGPDPMVPLGRRGAAPGQVVIGE